MTQKEFRHWQEFHKLYPFDDLHRYHRPAALVASAFAGDLVGRLDWLQPPPEVAVGAWEAVDAKTLRALGVKAPIH